MMDEKPKTGFSVFMEWSGIKLSIQLDADRFKKLNDRLKERMPDALSTAAAVVTQFYKDPPPEN